MKAPLVALLTLLLVACSSGFVRKDPDFRLESGSTFAWSSSTTDGIPADIPLDMYLESVAKELERRGVTRSTTASADYYVDVQLSIQRRSQQNDPVFSLYVEEEVEEAIVRVSIRDADSNRERWVGECHHELRLLRRSLGGTPPLWEEMNREREWLPQAEIDRIFERLAKS